MSFLMRSKNKKYLRSLYKKISQKLQEEFFTTYVAYLKYFTRPFKFFN